MCSLVCLEESKLIAHKYMCVSNQHRSFQYIGKMRRSKERKMFANNHYKKIIAHKLLQAWKVRKLKKSNFTLLVYCAPTHPQTHLSLYRDKRARQLRVQGHFSAGLQGRVFSLWVVYVSEERARRELHSTAVGHFKSVTLKKVNSIIVCFICVCTVSMHLCRTVIVV